MQVRPLEAQLRTFSPDHGELIFYQRVDQDEPRESFYVRSRTSQPAQMLDALTLANGVVGRVQKLRTVYIIGKSRIHLDKLDIGDFLEIEVVLADDESTESGIRAAHNLLEQLGIAPAQLIGGAYIDMLTIKAGLS